MSSIFSESQLTLSQHSNVVYSSHQFAVYCMCGGEHTGTCTIASICSVVCVVCMIDTWSTSIEHTCSPPCNR